MAAWRWGTAAAAALAAVLPGGCDADVVTDRASPPAPGQTLGELRRHAAQLLDRYDEAAAAAAPSAAVEISAPPWDATNPPPGLSIAAAKGAPGGTRLTVTFTGARGPATEPCGADYFAEAVESARAVVVILVEESYAAGETCPLLGYERTATATLAWPLGDRAVLEVREGQSVPVEPALIME
ncbi:hypothetical protein [Actinoplanes sp. NPDC049316]|uniref:hypothetical protein n=1 Tax=Actinoplanes sp. NPDC049316 TaxID=3154727 RepID=UPI0034381332